MIYYSYKCLLGKVIFCLLWFIIVVVNNSMDSKMIINSLLEVLFDGMVILLFLFLRVSVR